MADAATEFAALSFALREAGETGLKRELDKAFSDAAQPITQVIGSVGHLDAFMPNRYAAVLAPDLKVSVRKRSTGDNPGVSIIGTTRQLNGVQRRRIIRLNRGILAHPFFGNRKKWYDQGLGKGVEPGFFDRPVQESGPSVRDQIEQAVARVRDQIYAAR